MDALLEELQIPGHIRQWVKNQVRVNLLTKVLFYKITNFFHIFLKAIGLINTRYLLIIILYFHIQCQTRWLEKHLHWKNFRTIRHPNKLWWRWRYFCVLCYQKQPGSSSWLADWWSSPRGNTSPLVYLLNTKLHFS